MAIPFSFPNSDDVDDGYRSLDLLLEQLLLTLRQVLAHRRLEQNLTPSPVLRQRSINTNVIPTTTVTETNILPNLHHTASNPAQDDGTSSTPLGSHPRLPLPDLIPEMSPDCDEPRRKIPVPVSETLQTSVSSWVQVGAELRRIADNFKAEQASQQNVNNRKPASAKDDSSLISLLCPGIAKSLCTAVAFILSWSIFSRTR